LAAGSLLADRADGNGILGHILGSKDVSRQVAAQASARTGIGADVLKKMLPLVATLAMGESAGWIVSIVGAIIVLAVYRLVTKRRAA
jgi:hypothetical protein